MYGTPAWQPWLAATRLKQLERCQIRALYVITGQLQTTPVETLRREAGVCSMTTLMRRQTAIAYEKAARLTLDHPCRRLLNSPVRHRLVRPSWRSAAQSLVKELPRTITSRELLPDQIDCPLSSKGSWEVYPEGAAPQQANTANLSLQLIRETKAHVTIYTDGSATG